MTFFHSGREDSMGVAIHVVKQHLFHFYKCMLVNTGIRTVSILNEKLDNILIHVHIYKLKMGIKKFQQMNDVSDYTLGSWYLMNIS